MSIPASIELDLRQVLVTKYWKVASLTILLYDYLLTFEHEVTLIWKSSWGIGKVLFLLTRYSALIDTPLALYVFMGFNNSVETCMRIDIVSASVSVLGLGSAEAMLFLRTAALYNNAIKVSISLLLIWAFAQITLIVLFSLYLHNVSFGTVPLRTPILWGCHPMAGSKIIYGTFIVMLLQETIVVLFTVYRVVQTGIRIRDRLTQTLFRDGLLYYLFLVVISIGNIIVSIRGPLPLTVMTQLFQRVMHAVLSTRVLLNARGVARPKELTTSDLQSVFTSFISGTLSIPDDYEQHRLHPINSINRGSNMSRAGLDSR